MDVDVKAAWVKALESGEYAQGKKVLHNETDDTYCCLGVLCDLAVRSGEVEVEATRSYRCSVYRDEDGRSVEIDSTMYNDAYFGSLPKVVMDWAGLDHDLGRYVDSEGSDTTLAWQNDTEGKNFDEIAQIIKEHF